MVLQNFIKCDYEKGVSDGKRLNSDEMQTIFEILQKSYDVYGRKFIREQDAFQIQI